MKRFHYVLSRRKQKKFIDKLIYVAAIAYPLAGVPQAIQIFATKSAEDISIHSYTLFLVFETIFLAYAFYNKLRPIIISSVLWITYFIIVIVGIIVYR